MTIFLCSLFPDSLISVIRRNSIGPMANANNSLQRSIIMGLNYYFKDIYIITAPCIGAYPNRYKSIKIDYIDGEIIKGINGISLSFLNIVGYKNFNRYFQVSKHLNSLNGDVLFVYDLHLPFLIAAAKYKKKNVGTKICLIVPDLHGFTGESEKKWYKSKIWLEDKLLNKYISEVDSFVLISKYMREKIKIGGKPSVVIEGILPPFLSKEIALKKDRRKERQILYSGALDIRNGVDRLIQAFLSIDKDNYILIICGDGELRQYVESCSKVDQRIRYLGQISQDELFVLQQESTLLVNPRMPDQTFTRYSFPSKMMEYFASGNPVLSYKLDGIPDEYFDYCYVIKDMSVKALAEKIVLICEKDKEERDSFGHRAKKFISEKNAVSQCKLIKELIED